MTLAIQFWTMFMMFLGGLALGAIFDLFRVLHAQFHLPRWVLAVMDIAYWVAATALIFRLLYASNNGELRLFVFIGLAIGAFAYAMLLSKLTVRIFQFVFATLKAIFRIGVKTIDIVIVKPAIGLYRVAIVLLGFLRAFTIFLYKIVLQLLYPFWKLTLWAAKPLTSRIRMPGLLRRGGDRLLRLFQRIRKGP